ncbi:hypothetical protein LUQ84_002422 [Hamiltosporidium tvaerminnensis]|nr:hypothetical protein LUQ84_002422 [Hamiltosporidium tvaerminnensis]
MKSRIETSLIFQDHLSKINEFIFYEKTVSIEIYEVPEIRKIENVHIIEDIINNIKNVYQQSSLEDAIMCNKNIPERNKDLYLKLLKKDNFKDKIKIFEFLILYLGI